MTHDKLTICYFGIFDPEFSRNAVYIKGLRERGMEVRVCTDTSPGFGKYWNIVKMFLKIRKSIDIVIVGYSGHVLVPLTKILSLVTIQKPVYFDALCSFYESNILSRDAFKNIPLRIPLCHFVDWCANTFADKIIVETEQQKKYYINTLKVPESKCIVAYTGVNEDQFYFDSHVKKLDTFTVLFRGKFTKEAGVPYILDMAQLLGDHGINLRIIGFGHGDIDREIQDKIKQLNLRNVEFINKYLPIEELRIKMSECHVSLGQFGDTERLTRTIPHKAFEAMVMRMPYITPRTAPLEEIFEDRKNCIFVDKESVVQGILELKNNSQLQGKIISGGIALHEIMFIPSKIVENIISSAKQ